MAQYRGVPLGELSPHVYAIAEQVPGGGCGERRRSWLCGGEGASRRGWRRCHRVARPWAQHHNACLLRLLCPHPTPTPHPLQAYAAMMMDEQRQAILISGESGAGKTESAKLVMQVQGGRGLAGGHHECGASLDGGVTSEAWDRGVSVTGAHPSSYRPPPLLPPLPAVPGAPCDARARRPRPPHRLCQPGTHRQHQRRGASACGPHQRRRERTH